MALRREGKRQRRGRQPLNRRHHGPFLRACDFPFLGRSREKDFGPGCRSVTVGEYVIVYCFENDDALILRVAHGRRDLEALFGQ